MRRRLAVSVSVAVASTAVIAVAVIAAALLAGGPAQAGTGAPTLARPTSASASVGARASVGASASVGWSNARQLPGLAALNVGTATGAYAGVQAASCPSAGNCTVGGYDDSGPDNRDQQAFVVAEVGGKWRQAAAVPGLAALDTGRFSQVASVSCASAGDCTAVGSYRVAHSGDQVAFAATQTRGRWSAAAQLPGLAALAAAHQSAALSVSCGSAGDCSAGGYYQTNVPAGLVGDQAFIANEAGGRWSTAIEVPGTAAANVGHQAAVASISCVRSGACLAGGHYSSRAYSYGSPIVTAIENAFVTSKP